MPGDEITEGKRSMGKLAWIKLVLGTVITTVALSNGCTTGPVDGPPPPPPPPAVTAELGYTDQLTGAYNRVGEGEVMPLFTAGQGGSHFFATYRVTGFPVEADGSAEILVDQFVMLAETGSVLHDFDQPVLFQTNAAEILEVPSRLVFLNGLPFFLNEQVVNVDFTLTSVADPKVSARIQQSVMLVMLNP